VVLPLANLSGDPEQGYFADGITEDLTTDLSRIADMLVISRNSAFTYKDKPVNAKQIGRELCVRYVLEGSVRRSGSQIRVRCASVSASISWALPARPAAPCAVARASGQGVFRPNPNLDQDRLFGRPAARNKQFWPIVPDVVDRPLDWPDAQPVGGQGAQQRRHIAVLFPEPERPIC
jgi:hypothetical protein